MTTPGVFVTFEGIEGSGKTTQIARLAERLRSRGVEVVVTREPGGTDLGRQLRRVLLRPAEQPMSAEAELLLYAADRAQHLVEVVEPALARGVLVLCDRYLDATLAYQGHGRGLGVERILALHDTTPLDRRPDRTLLFDIDVATALGRARSRDAGATALAEGRFEEESLAFHGRVRDGYLALAAAEPGRVRVVDARGETDEVTARVRAATADLLPSNAGSL